MHSKAIIVALLVAASVAAFPAHAQDVASSAEILASVETSPNTGASDATQGSASNAEVAAGFDIGVSAEQAAQIRQAVVEMNVVPIAVDFDIALGIAIPATVTLSPVPRSIVAVVPRLDGYLYFVLHDGRIVIVSPNTLTVTVIIRA